MEMRLKGKGFWIGLILVLGLTLASVLAPILAPFDPTDQMIVARMSPPAWMDGGSMEHPLGTDHLGRDILSRLLYAARLSIIIGVVTAVASSLVGTLIGVVAGYYGGWLSTVLMRLLDIQTAFPYLVIAVAVVAVLGPTPTVIIVTLALWTWVPFGRVAHAATLRARGTEYVEQSRISGATDTRILLRHVLPNVLPSTLVIWAFAVSQVIVAESALSFLGLGIQPPTATLGGMVSDGRNYLGLADWIALVPAATIVAVTLGVNLVGDGLRDRVEPDQETSKAKRGTR